MEVEMDKFLAKKHAIFAQTKSKTKEKSLSSEQQVRYRTNGCILQLALKSLYEFARHHLFLPSTYLQLQCDTFFLFQVCFSCDANDTNFDILPSLADETTPIYCGLFNEVMSSARARMIKDDGRTMDETLLYTMS